MTTTVEVKTEEIYPADYKIHNIGDNLALRFPTKTEYYTVFDRNKVQSFVKQDTTNWLLTSGSTYNAGDITDWLEPETDTLYLLAVELLSDRNIEFRVFNPQSDQLGGIKNAPDAVITPNVSLEGKPTMTLMAWGTNFIPHFKLTNPTEYTPTYVIIKCYGFKYRLAEIEKGKGIPAKYDVVDFTFIK